MKTNQNMFHLMVYNWKPLVTFEIFYKVITAALVIPGIRGLITLILKMSGYKYLTIENAGRFFRNPVTLSCVVVLLVLMTFYSMIDIGTVIYILDQSSQNHKTSVRVSFRYALKKALRMFLPQNLPMVLVILFMIPFLHLGFASSLISTVDIPEFIKDEILVSLPKTIAMVLLFMLVGYILLRWIYIFNYYVLETKGFFIGAHRSAKLGKNHRWADFFMIMITQVFLALLYYVTTFLGATIIALGKKLCDSLGMAGLVLSSIIVVFLGIMLVIFLALSMPVSYAVITMLFYRRKEEENEELTHTPMIERKGDKRAVRREHIIWLIILILAVVACGVTIYRTYHGKLSLDVERVHTMEVSAHRGASIGFPENTMSAFRAAYYQGTDLIELDVQQSRDGVVYVMHDSNFLRTCGVNKNSWEMNWEDIQKLDAGKWYNAEKFTGEKVPSLDEVLHFAKISGIRLNIELKPTGHEKYFEQNVIDLIRKYDFEDNCVVTSQNYKTVKKVKEIEPDIRTVYVMSVAVGNLNAMKAADDFSVNSSFATRALVEACHNKGHRVYAWTVNRSQSIDQMITAGVDNIITNNVPLAKDRIASSRVSNVVDDLIIFLKKL